MDYIEIKGFKSMKDVRVDIRPINIFIGSNGSGKSNFISFFEFLNWLYNKKLKEYVADHGGEEKILHNGSASTSELYFKTEFNQGRNGYSVTVQRVSEGFAFKKELLIYNGDQRVNISNFESEARIKVTDNYRAKYVIRYLESFRKYHFHDTGKNSPFNKMSHIQNDKYFLYKEGDNMAAFLYFIHEKHKIVYNRIIQTIQSIAPYFSDFYFKPSEEGFLRLQWQDKYSSTIYGTTDLSDGTIRFIALSTLFLQPEPPAMIIIDEPELGLHPFAISKLAGMIQSAAARGTQVLVATQSSDLVNHFTAEDIITVDRQGSESKFNRLQAEDLEAWLSDYSIGDLWQRNIIHGGQPS